MFKDKGYKRKSYRNVKKSDLIDDKIYCLNIRPK